jgi:hypothetical protein
VNGVDISSVKSAWEDYQNATNLNDLGRLNLVAYIGERGGRLIAEIERLRTEVERLQGSALVWHDAAREQPTDIYEKFVYYGAAHRFDVTYYNPRLGKWHALAGHVVTHWAEPIAPSEPPEEGE